MKKIRASTGFAPVTSALPVRCSTNWAMKPHIGSEVNLLSSYLPWGIKWCEVNTTLGCAFVLPKITLCFLSRKKPNHQFIIYGLSGRLLSFSARSLWLTESKALLKSIANIRTALHLGSSRNLQILFWISNRASVQLPPSLYANWLSNSYICFSIYQISWRKIKNEKRIFLLINNITE